MPPSKDETTKQFWARWAANQGAAVVILSAVLYAIYESVPKHIDAIKQGYADIERSHREERQSRDTLFIEELRKERELMRAMLDKIDRRLTAGE